MKKVLIVLIVSSFIILLSSCFGTVTKFPDMVEYLEDEVLEVAKEKYNIKNFYYTSLRADKNHNAKEEFSFDNYDCYGIFNNIKNPHNLEKALTSFAGKNGGHDIQGQFHYFACYIALGVDYNDNVKLIYYNTNINKNEKIEDTIGSSDYPFDLEPSKINTKFIDEIKWDALRINLQKQCGDEINIKGLYYGFDKPTIITSLNSTSGTYLVQFYEEDSKVVFDLFEINVEDYYEYDHLEKYIKSKELIYSTSYQYECIYPEYGRVAEDYFNIEFSVEQSTEASYLDLVSGTITVKDVGKEVINYGFNYKISYKVLKNGKLYSQEELRSYTELINNRFGILIDQIEGHNHEETTDVYLLNYYIIYKK